MVMLWCGLSNKAQHLLSSIVCSPESANETALSSMEMKTNLLNFKIVYVP